MKLITSTENSLIKKFRSLSVKKYREQFGLYLLEGEKVVLEALKVKGAVVNLIIKESAISNFSGLIERFNDLIILVSDEVYNSLCFAVTPQNIMAVVKSNTSKTINPNLNLIVLDRLQDPGNLGTIIRSSVASGHLDIVLINSVDPFNDKTVRSASGTILYPNFYKMTPAEFVDFATKNDLNVVVADMNGKSIYDEKFEVEAPYALVIGNEGQGVSSEIKKISKTTISIPMDERVESLNAGVSASIIMFNLTKGQKRGK